MSLEEHDAAIGTPATLESDPINPWPFDWWMNSIDSWEILRGPSTPHKCHMSCWEIAGLKNGLIEGSWWWVINILIEALCPWEIPIDWSLLSRHITWLLSQVPRGPSSCGNKAWSKALPFCKKKHTLWDPKKQQLHYFDSWNSKFSVLQMYNYPVFQTVPYSARWFNEKSTGLVLSTDVIDVPGIIFCYGISHSKTARWAPDPDYKWGEVTPISRVKFHPSYPPL